MAEPVRGVHTTSEDQPPGLLQGKGTINVILQGHVSSTDRAEVGFRRKGDQAEDNGRGEKPRHPETKARS